MPILGFGQCTSGDCQNGYGTFTSEEGTYKGSWKDGRVHGNGMFVGFEYTYDGEYINGEKHGQGKKTYPNGTIEEGLFENGKFVKKTIGCISGNCENDWGVYKWYDGSSYTGYWKYGKKHGEGTFIDKSGGKYVGEWKNGKEHGKGSHTFSYGTVKKGKWINGVYQKPKTTNTSSSKKSSYKPTKKRSYSSWMHPKNQIGYIFSPACPWGLNYYHFFHERFGWYVDYKFTWSMASSDYWPAFERDFVEDRLDKTMTGDQVLSSGRYTVFNGGLSTRIGGDRNSVWIFNVGLGAATEMSYDEYSPDYSNEEKYRSYVRNGGVSKINLNLGILRQTSSLISWQLGFDSSGPGINFGMGFTLD